MISEDTLQELVEINGTPLFVIDHDELRNNYAIFKKNLPRVQAYYAVKANPDPMIVKTLFEEGASFDISSNAEFETVYKNINDLPEHEQHDWLWKNVIYANPIKADDTLKKLNEYKPLLTFDNSEEIRKIKECAPDSGVVLRLNVSNADAMVELSSKFGASHNEALELIFEAIKGGLTVEGLSFHVGSQTTNFENYVQAINISALIFKKAKYYGYEKMDLLDIGGGFPVPYDESIKPFSELAKIINTELDRLFPVGCGVNIVAEPGRFIVATAATAVAKIIGKAIRHGKLCYYIDDGVYHTFSGVIFEHCQYHFEPFKRIEPTEICTVFGPTCDGLDVISVTEKLPSLLERGDLLYSKNIGAYSRATSTYFNGFPPAKVIHVNR